MASGDKQYTLGFIIGAQLKSSFTSAFKSAEKQIAATKKAVADAGQKWSEFGQNAKTLVVGATATATAVTAAVWKMTESVADQGDRAYKAAQKLKMSTEAYQELEYAFRQSGLESEEFNKVMVKLDQSLINAASSASSSAKFAEEYGLSAEKLARYSPEKRIERLADYLKQVEDPLKRDKIAIELFGKSYAEMVRVLDMGSEGIQELRKEARETGNVLDDETARMGEVYGDMKDKMLTTISGIKVQLFGGLLPAFAGAFDGISNQLKSVNWAEMGDKIAAWATDAAPKIKEFAIGIGEVAMKVASGVSAVAAFVGGWKNLAYIVAAMLAFKTVLSGAQAVMATLNAVSSAGTVVRQLLTTRTIGAAGAETVLTAATVKATVAQKAAAIASKALNVALMFGVVGAIIAVVAGIIWMVKNWDKVKEAVTNAITKVKEVIGGAVAWIKDNWKMILGFMVNPIGAALAYAYNHFEGFRNFVDGIVAKVKSIFQSAWDLVSGGAKAAVDKIMAFFSPLSGFFQGIGDKVSGIWSKVTGGGGGGGAPTPSPMPGHADGGIFNRQHTAQIAERGPEAVVPLDNRQSSRNLWETAGKMAGFTTNNNSSSSNVSVPVSVSIQVAGGATPETAEKIKGEGDKIGAIIAAKVKEILDKRGSDERRLAY